MTDISKLNLAVEKHIKTLDFAAWVPITSEQHIKSLVAGNIRHCIQDLIESDVIISIIDQTVETVSIPDPPPENEIMKFFEFKHLKPRMIEVSKPICELAKEMDYKIPNSAEKTSGLRKLLEAKDCLVRAVL